MTGAGAIRQRIIGRDRSRRGLARLALVLFALRALLPVGFMPDIGLLKQGGFQIVLCTAQGPTAITVDADGAPIDRDGGQDPADAAFAKDCPFGTAFAKAFDVPAAIATAVLSVPTASATATSRVFHLRPPSHGPPLGSRAPPVLLG